MRAAKWGERSDCKLTLPGPPPPPPPPPPPHPQHTERIAAYWAKALDGPTTYCKQYGDEIFVVRIHSGNGAAREYEPEGDRLF